MSFDLCHYCNRPALKSVPAAGGRVVDVCERHAGGPPITAAYVAPAEKVGRNDPCPCGSGKKWKKCCRR